MSRFILLLLIIAGIFLYFRSRQIPDHFKLSRSRKIDATPSQLKALLADLSKDVEWNPFMQNDPALKYQLSENPSGVGAKIAWQGKRSGAGESIVLEADNNHVRRSLTMLKPMHADNIVDFVFGLEDGQTVLTWTMSGKTTGMQRLFQTVVNSEKMIGGAFDNGLDQIENYFKD